MASQRTARVLHGRPNMGTGPGGAIVGPLHSYQRHQLPTTPDQKGNDQKDKEARGEQLASGMRGGRKVKTIIRFARVAYRRLRCSLSAQSNCVRERYGFSPKLPDPERSRYQEVPRLRPPKS